MNALFTKALDYLGNLLGYTFWLGGTLWLLKRALKMHGEVEGDPADAIRVPYRVGCLFTFKRNVTKISISAIGVQVLAISWFTLVAMVSGYIVNAWVYYIFWFSGAVMGIVAVVYLMHRLIYWWKHR